MACLSNAAFASPAPVPCDPAADTYVECLERSLLTEHELRLVGEQRLVLKDEVNGVMSADRERLQKALTDQQGILSSPQFWLGVGVVSGIILTVVTGVVVAQGWKK